MERGWKPLHVNIGTAITLLLVALAIWAFKTWGIERVNDSPPASPVGPVTDASEPMLNGFWRSDSRLGETLFFRILSCGADDIEIVSKYVVLPYGNAKVQGPVSQVSKEDPTCKVLHAESRPIQRVGRPTILIVVYQRRGVPSTLKTTAFFFDPATARLGKNTAPVDREDLPGNRLDNYRMREIQLQLSYPENEATFMLPELFEGNPVEMGFGVNGKAFLFEPLTRTVAFCARQGGKIRSHSAELDPAYAGEHTITLRYDDRKRTTGLRVDGKAIPLTRSFRDEQCKQSLRPQ